MGDVDRDSAARTTSSTDTDPTTDVDVNPDSSDAETDSCDEVSVNSFTFSPSTSETHHPCASSEVLLDHAGTDARAEDVDVGDSIKADSKDASNGAEFRINKVFVDLTRRALTNGSAVNRYATATSIASDGTSEIPGSSPQTSEREAIQPPCWSNGHQTDDVIQLVPASIKDIPVEMARSSSRDRKPSEASEDHTPCDRPRYRTSISLSIAPPSVSSADNKLVCHSTSNQPRLSPVRPSVMDSGDLQPPPLPPSSPPPLPKSARPNVTGPARSHPSDEASNIEDQRMNGELVNVRSSPDDDDDDVKVREQRWFHETDAAAAVSQSDKVEFNHVSDHVRPTSATASTGMLA